VPWVVWVLLFTLNAVPWIGFSIADIRAIDAHWLSRAGMLWGRDFSNQWLGGMFAIRGLNVYDHVEYQKAIEQFGITAFQNYSYPPHTLLVAAFFSLLPYPLALILWALLGSILFYYAAKPFVPFSPWLVLLVPSVARLPYGQFGLLTSAFTLLSMRGSGVAAGLLTMKPHLGVLLAPVLAVKKRFRQMVIALVVTALLLTAAEALFGLGRAYLTQGIRTPALLLQTSYDAAYFSVMPSAYVALRHTGWEWIGQAAVTVAALFILWQFRRASLQDLAFPLATATFIVLPFSFAYDMALVSVGFAIILYCSWKDSGWPQRALAIAAFSSPNLVWTHCVPLILIAGLWLQLKVWRRTSAADDCAAAAMIPNQIEWVRGVQS